MKKHPERVRKVPSRKVCVPIGSSSSHRSWSAQLDGVGCPASISYKTYYDTEEVRACCMLSISFSASLH